MPCDRLIGVLLAVLVFVTPAFGQPAAAGRIKSASGETFVVRQSTATALQAGQLVYETDILRTGTNGRLGVMLKDETRLSMGPNSEVRLDRFVYAPGEGRLGMALRIARGVVAYVSGRIAKLSPDSVHLEIPAAIVGIRGTRLVIRVEP